MPAILISGLHGRRLGAELSEPLGQRLREAWLGTPGCGLRPAEAEERLHV